MRRVNPLGKQLTEDILLSSLAQLTTLIDCLDDKDNKHKYEIDNLKTARIVILGQLKRIAWDEYKRIKCIADDS